MQSQQHSPLGPHPCTNNKSWCAARRRRQGLSRLPLRPRLQPQLAACPPNRALRAHQWWPRRDASTGSPAGGMGHVGARVVPKSCNSQTTTCGQQSGLVQARKNGADGAGAAYPSSGGPGGGALAKRRKRLCGPQCRCVRRDHRHAGQLMLLLHWRHAVRGQRQCCGQLLCGGRVQRGWGRCHDRILHCSPHRRLRHPRPRRTTLRCPLTADRCAVVPAGVGAQYVVVAPAPPSLNSAAAQKLAAALTLPTHRVAQLEAQRQLPRVAVVASNAPALRPAKTLAAPPPAPMPAPALTPAQVSWDTSSALLDPCLLCLTPGISCLLW